MTIFVVWRVDCLRNQAAKLAKIFDMRRILKCLAVLLLFFSIGSFKAYAQYDKDVFYMRGRNALAEEINRVAGVRLVNVVIIK